MFSYDAPTLEECPKIAVNYGACVGYVERVTMIRNDSISLCLASCNKLLNLKIKISVRINSCMRLSIHNSTYSLSHSISRRTSVVSAYDSDCSSRGLYVKISSYSMNDQHASSYSSS